MDAEYIKQHDAGCELMGRGTGVPDSLKALADHIEAALGENLSDGLIASLGSVLLRYRDHQKEVEGLRAELRSRANG